MPFNILSVAIHASLTTVSTGLSHYLGKTPDKTEPRSHFSYHGGLEIVRRFLEHAARHTVEELQAFTSQKVPPSYWVATGNVIIPPEHLAAASHILIAELGPNGVSAVGGSKWWQWRDTEAALIAEWLETRRDYNDRRARNVSSNRIILYVHGGAYYFGSVDTHRYQLQRHARKLKARLARFRLAPQFPFPCGLHDCLAAYLYLITIQKPEEIILAGDSSGGGMVMSMLITLRDQNVALPAGAVLISPWVDLTHSFPSVSGSGVDDYIPISGFMHRPSMAWPPPNLDEYGIESTTGEKILNTINSPPVLGATSSRDNRVIEEFYTRQARATAQSTRVDEYTTSQIPGANRIHRNVDAFAGLLRVSIDGATVEVKDQVHMYTTNSLINHPLVSPVLQPSLGGLPPMLVLAGGGEVLRDEQIYLAHKAANPSAYLPSDEILNKYDPEGKALSRYPPTNVQLQVWNSLCHVAPTLSFTRPAFYMYRSIAQFSAWALSRAQETSIDIPEISPTSSAELLLGSDKPKDSKKRKPEPPQFSTVGKAGDSIPPFKNHMIRQTVDPEGNLFPLPEERELPALQVPRNQIGLPKSTPVRRWLAAKGEWDEKFSREREKLQKQRIKHVPLGIEDIAPGERPPPSSQAARRGVGVHQIRHPTKKSIFLSLWNKIGAVHDAKAMEMECKQEGGNEFPTLWRGGIQDGQAPTVNTTRPRGMSTARIVTDIGQINETEQNMPTPPETIPEASVPQIQKSALRKDPEKSHPLHQRGYSSAYDADQIQNDGNESATEPTLDSASVRTIRHSEGVISPIPGSSVPTARDEIPLEYSSVNRRAVKPVGTEPPVIKAMQSIRPATETRPVPETTEATIPPLNLNPIKRQRYDFDSTEQSTMSSSLEPFPPLQTADSADVLEAGSEYSSHYSSRGSSK